MIVGVGKKKLWVEWRHTVACHSPRPRCYTYQQVLMQAHGVEGRVLDQLVRIGLDDKTVRAHSDGRLATCTAGGGGGGSATCTAAGSGGDSATRTATAGGSGGGTGTRTASGGGGGGTLDSGTGSPVSGHDGCWCLWVRRERWGGTGWCHTARKVNCLSGMLLLL